MPDSRPPRTDRGFSLIELLIVASIIAVISAIAIPYLVQSQQAARYASAISSLRTIHSSQMTYRTVKGVYTDLATLGDSGQLSDTAIAAGEKSNYRFTVSLGADPTLSFTVDATPTITPTLWNHYFADQSGLIRFNAGAAATIASPLINK
ncbi:MAG TPA: prepilin-type N-terminal cleavage/methylation domain-containing protein [Pyrinomonadaceae bacterium]|jgi:prepilin-type N-terminal cleavage/methylation domain-containing protein